MVETHLVPFETVANNNVVHFDRNMFQFSFNVESVHKIFMNVCKYKLMFTVQCSLCTFVQSFNFNFDILIKRQKLVLLYNMWSYFMVEIYPDLTNHDFNFYLVYLTCRDHYL